jgi:hypothetical protein
MHIHGPTTPFAEHHKPRQMPYHNTKHSPHKIAPIAPTIGSSPVSALHNVHTFRKKAHKHSRSSSANLQDPQ